MKCAYCGCTQSRVVDSRQSDDGTTIRRRRVCENCGLTGNTGNFCPECGAERPSSGWRETPDSTAELPTAEYFMTVPLPLSNM